MKEYFKSQLMMHSPIPESVYENIEYKVVWSGEHIQIGDIVVYAYVFDPKDEGIKMISFIDRELEKMGTIFDFVEMTEEQIPILKFKTDHKNRK